MRTADDRRAALQRGAEAEDFVWAHYRSMGWRLLARNLRVGGAELDLVVERDGFLRVIEVKQRDPRDPHGVEVITSDKQRRLGRGARAFLQTYEDVVEEVTFDVAVVRAGPDGFEIELWEHAFDVS